MLTDQDAHRASDFTPYARGNEAMQSVTQPPIKAKYATVVRRESAL